MRKMMLLFAIALLATACTRKSAEDTAMTPNAMTTTQPATTGTASAPASASTVAPGY
ncbi:hypothetical protein LK996_02240 [Lysobacter sp. A6]|uniref:Lipoprotein n=1 Tax=Noviluteimonas lactosilytica TaxID=2888523 RepID=A0ABS8JE69_9GAMM|nr:hypothetical protein [Lysobacter lactosilyticus]MCC8361904.1 hypothetical protein [Lysobacter lactosilyticus]